MAMAHTEKNAPPTPRAGGPLRFVRRVGWALVWIVGATVGLLAAATLAAWLWAATPGSLAQTLGWAQSWLKGQDTPMGQLTTEGVDGSLRGGGRIAALQWTQDGLRVEARGVQIGWRDALFTDLIRGNGARIDQVTVDKLSVHDERPPAPTEPMV